MTPSDKSQTSATTGGAYRVLARKYRPQNFDDLIGQEPMVQTLTNAFATGRIAQAYMLTGVRGVGKTTTARILARALNYKTDTIDEPTIDVKDLGEHCQAIIDGRHVDVIEMDAASHTGIDDIREIIEAAQYNPASARYKVYVIDEVHMLSRSAFNGLLKTLEEPPAHLKFIFATTEIRKVPVTVLSRCQRFDLRRIDGGVMITHLKKVLAAEELEAEEEALAVIARACEGSVRDALSMLDQAIAHASQADAKTLITADATRAMLGLSDRARIVDLFEQVMRGDLSAALTELRTQYDIGADPAMVLSDLADFIHFVTKLKYVPETAEDLSLTDIEREKGLEFANTLSVRVLGRAWQILLKGIGEVEQTERAITAAEMVLVRLTHASSLPSPDEVIRSLQNGETLTPSPAKANGKSDGSDASAVRSTAPVAAAPSTPGTPSTQTPLAAGTGNVVALKSQQSAEPQPVPSDAAPSEPPPPAITLNTFEELIYLCENKRDIALKAQLRTHVRLVSFSDGRMQFNLVGNPKPTFMSDLSARLQEWTGKRWMVATSHEEGLPTLAEQDETDAEERVDKARSNPVVNAVLAKFPGSKIVDVRLSEDDAATNAANMQAGLDDDEIVEADAAPNEDTLDDFF